MKTFSTADLGFIIVDFVNHIPYLHSMPHNSIPSIRAFNRFYTGFLGLLDQHILESSFSLPEARVLFELNQKDSIQASEIVDSLGIDKGYLSRILDQFSKEKLISKKRSREDGRRQHLYLTDKGHKTFERLNRASDEQLKGLLKGMPEGDLTKLEGHMKGIEGLLGEKTASKTDITIRTDLRPGDLGYVTHLHGRIYKEECNYGINFEAYVAQGLAEFWKQYDARKDSVWIVEHGQRMVGFLLSMHREKDAAQLRYFILEPEYRGLGLGKKLMNVFMAHLKEKGYQKAYLWTTNEQETAIALYQRHGFVLTEEKHSEAFGKALREQRYDRKV
jgi:DNA-binding MarR family transcriptional regulator/ribosomal protein S18 acetylase RimI-like enzyme